MRLRFYMFWLVLCIFAATQTFVQNAGNVFSTAWMHSFHFSALGLAIFSSSYFYIYAMMQIPAGLCYTRFPVPYLLSIAFTAIGLCFFLLVSFPIVSVAYTVRLLTGIAFALAYIGMLKVTTQLFDAKQFPFMLGIATFLSMVLVSIALSITAYFLLHHTRYDILSVIAALALVLAALSLILGKGYPKPIAGHQRPLFSWSLFAFLKDRNILLGVAICVLINALLGGFTSLWGIQFLMHTRHLTAVSAARINSTVLLGVAVGSLGWGWLAKKTDQCRPLLLVAASGVSLTLLILLFKRSVPYIWLGAGYMLAGFFSSAATLCFTLIKRSVHSDMQALAMSFAKMMLILSNVFFQVLLGYLIAHPFGHALAGSAISYHLALSVLPLSTLLAVGLVFFLREESVAS